MGQGLAPTVCGSPRHGRLSWGSGTPWEAVPGLRDALGRPGKMFSGSGTPWEAVLRVWDVLGRCSEALGRPGALLWDDPDPPRGARAEFSPDGPMVEVRARFMEVSIHGGFELGAPWGPQGPCGALLQGVCSSAVFLWPWPHCISRLREADFSPLWPCYGGTRRMLHQHCQTLIPSWYPPAGG